MTELNSRIMTEYPLDYSDYQKPYFDLDGIPIKIYRLSLPEENSSSCRSENLQIIYISHGRMNICINSLTYLLTEGDMCLINSGAFFFFKQMENEPCDFFIAWADESVFSTDPIIRGKYILPLFHSFKPNVAIINKSNAYYDRIKKIFRPFGELCVNKPGGYDILLVGLLHEFLGLVFMALDYKLFLPASDDSSGSKEFCKMLEYINKNYSHKILVEDLASEAGISRKQCYNLFHKFTDQTPGDFINSHRLSIGKSMLRQPNIPISAIATSCGFSHQSHFTNLFNQKYGTTPKKYRMAFLKKDQQYARQYEMTPTL